MEAPTRPTERNTGPWLVVGADGSVGKELVRRWVPAGRNVIGTTRRANAGGAAWHLDLAAPPWTLPEQVAVAFLCAAITSGEQCRRFPEDTRRVNVDCTLELARQLRERGAHVVFLSTNQVFDGSVPHTPADAPVCPRTEYGRQKATVERELLSTGSAAVVRFGKIVSPDLPLFRSWAEALRKGEPIAPFADSVIAPVPVAFAADVLRRVAETEATGIIQVTAERDVSYAEMAFRLADRLGVARERVQPVSAASRGIAPEMTPPNTTLNTARTRADLGLSVPLVSETIDSLIEQVLHA